MRVLQKGAKFGLGNRPKICQYSQSLPYFCACISEFPNSQLGITGLRFLKLRQIPFPSDSHKETLYHTLSKEKGMVNFRGKKVS